MRVRCDRLEMFESLEEERRRIVSTSNTKIQDQCASQSGHDRTLGRQVPVFRSNINDYVKNNILFKYAKFASFIFIYDISGNE